MLRGEIYYIKNTKLANGCQPMADRPAVIVSNDMINAVGPKVEVVYLTTRPLDDMPTHVTCRSTGCASTVLCEQVYSINQINIGAKIGELTANELEAVDMALAISLGLDFDSTRPEVVEKIVEKIVTREYTDEELDYLLDRRERMRQLDYPPEASEPDRSEIVKLEAERIRVEAERDAYRGMYEKLLGMMINAGRTEAIG